MAVVVLGVVLAPEIVPDVLADWLLPGIEPDCVPVVPVCAPVVAVSGCAIGGVATVPAVVVVPDWVLVLVPGVGEMVELPVPDAPKLPALEAEPLSVLEPVVVPLFDVSFVPPWVDYEVELEGDGNVTVADELPPDVPVDELLPTFEPDLVAVVGVDDDCVWLEPDCAWSARVAANNAAVLVLANFRGIFIT